MKNVSKITALVFLSLGITGIFQSCNKDQSPPEIFTFQVYDVTQISAVSRSVVNDDGGAEVTARGVCWSIFPNPTTSYGKTTDGGGTGPYLSVISDLTPNTTYYVRSYATNIEGTNYGNELIFTTAAPISGIRKSDIPQSGFGSVSFSIGNKVYLGSGSGDEFASPRDFWEWDQITDIWTKKADFPGNSVRGAVGFSIATKGYLGTGLTFEGGVTNEFWEYDPATDKWTEKASLPVTAARTEAVGFSIGTKGYIGTGNFFTNNETKCLNDFWEYDPAADAWTEKASLPVSSARSEAVGFSIGNKGYIGTGLIFGSGWGANRDFWEWDQETDKWTRKADFGGLKRSGAIGFSIGRKGYIGTGSTYDENDLFNYSRDFWEWDQETNIWTRTTDLRGDVRQDAFTTSIGEKAYIGAGINDSGEWGAILNDFWEYEPDIYR